MDPDHDFDWQSSPIPNTRQWADRCFQRFMERDAQLDPADAQALADDMSRRQHWRAMLPEAAADALFEPISKPGG